MYLPLPDALPTHIAQDELLETGIDLQGFLDIASRYTMIPYTVLLLSGGSHDCSRYSILARKPMCILSAKGDAIFLRTAAGRARFTGDPLEAMDELFARLQPSFPLVCPPFSGGAVGYLAYELKNGIEHLPQSARDDLRLPDLLLLVPSEIWVHDQLQQTLRRLRLRNALTDQGTISGPMETAAARPAEVLRPGALRSNFSQPDYLQAVTRIRDYIRAGDVYQVNLSQRFSFPLEGNPFDLFTALFRLNPAPFYAFVQAGDHQILCTSMERFLLRRGNTIEARPIKGTRKRGATAEKDRMFREELAASKKDDAELSMIVDLLRNDLGRVCAPKSIRVLEHKRLEEYQNVYHLVSVIEGCLPPQTGYADLIRATFPGGSITGCPKIRSMEIIDQLEPLVRHVYTGSIGYLGWHRNMDLNIAIRTGITHAGQCHFAVGGGIVYDSDEQDEYDETLHKGRTLFDTIDRLQHREGE